MRLRHDLESGALYFRLREGDIAQTLQLPSPGAYLDVDAQGIVMGLEFLSFEEFVYFMDSVGGEAALPDRVESEAFLEPTEEEAEREREAFADWLETYRRRQHDRSLG